MTVPAEDDQASVTVTPNVADLSLGKTVDVPNPVKNQNVTFTVTLTNGGPATATGVTVTDLLPAGLTFVSSTPSRAATTTVQASGTSARLELEAQRLSITATVTTAGAKINTAEVTTSNQFDNDSTPGNGVPAEDDQASVTVTPQSADLSLTKIVDNATPNVGANVVFTLTLSNAGPTRQCKRDCHGCAACGIDVCIVNAKPGQLQQRHGHLDGWHGQQRRQRHAADHGHGGNTGSQERIQAK